MNVLVTGGTGFVGQEVLRQLNAAGHRCIVLARNPAGRGVRSLGSALGVELRVGDVLDRASLDRAVAGAEAIIHLVGIISEHGESTFENVHLGGTRNLVAAARAAGLQRFVHMSALGTRPDAASRYHQSKWAAEECVRRSGLAFTIFRPSLIYGPGDHFVNLFARIIRWSPIVPVLGRGRARFQPVAVEDVSRAFVRALDLPEARDRTFDLCGAQAFTLPQLIDEILAVMACKRFKLRLPIPVARAQAAALEWIFPVLFRRSPPLNRDQLLMLDEDNLGKTGPAQGLFGLAPKPFREGIATYLKRTSAVGSSS